MRMQQPVDPVQRYRMINSAITYELEGMFREGPTDTTNIQHDRSAHLVTRSTRSNRGRIEGIDGTNPYSCNRSITLAESGRAAMGTG